MIGTIFVQQRVAPRPHDTLTVWGGNGAPLLNPTSYNPNAALQDLEPQIGESTAQPVYIPPTKQDENTGEATSAFDIEAFIAQLTKPARTSATSSTSADVSYAYSFIPSGLIATSAPVRKRTKEQQALYDYGNEIGSYIQTYEDTHRNAPIILRDQVADRTNSEKASRVKAVAAALREVGSALAAMETIPSSVKGMHTELAASYTDLGTKLALVPDAQADQALLNAINAYNASADRFASVYVALATYFSTSGVVFSSQDPGSVFTFNNSAGI